MHTLHVISFFLKNLFKENVQAKINQKFLRTNPAVSQLRASLVYFAHLFLWEV